jgi:hypothetical protein
MRIKLMLLAALLCFATTAPAQTASIAFGNYQGGLIPSQANLRDREFRAAVMTAANEHCAFYDRIATITGVVPGYGNYISFTCHFARGYDPVRLGRSFWWSPR